MALGPRAGQPVRRLRSAADAIATGRRSARLEGFSLHADVAVPARRRDQLERVCRYILRPPLALERITESTGGQLGGWTGCQSPGGPYIDRAVTALVLFALETLQLDGLEAAFADRRHRENETVRERAAQVSALDRRAKMLEAAISEARTPEARTRLVARFDEILMALQAARVESAQAQEPADPGLTPELIASLV